MQSFFPVVRFAVGFFGYRRICEIGSRLGRNADRLRTLAGAEVEIIDPGLHEDLLAKFREYGNVTVHNGLSLEVLPELREPFECILIDGDHNWYTVYHELAMIRSQGLLAPHGAVFFHDVAWPYGRRDMYYQPEAIPEEFRHPYRKAGIVRGRSALVEGGVRTVVCSTPRTKADHEMACAPPSRISWRLTPASTIFRHLRPRPALESSCRRAERRRFSGPLSVSGPGCMRSWSP
jgi:hypothetical protein